jgi:hypothetical protein
MFVRTVFRRLVVNVMSDSSPPIVTAELPPHAPSLNSISDKRFVGQLQEVKDLKQFLFEQKVRFEPTQLGSIDLGSLNNLYFSSTGRVPTSEEWKLLDEKIAVLASYLSDELRQKIRVRELSVFFDTLPLIFLLATLATVLYRFLYGGFLTKGTLLFNASFLLSLIVWTVAQGGLGACAFLGTRLATKHSEKGSIDNFADVADITDESILRIRIVLGCLFGSLIGVPIGSLAFDKMGTAIYDSNISLTPSDFALIVLPFMVGFSTNLVLAILERFIESIRTFFGIGAR